MIYTTNVQWKFSFENNRIGNIMCFINFNYILKLFKG